MTVIIVTSTAFNYLRSEQTLCDEHLIGIAIKVLGAMKQCAAYWHCEFINKTLANQSVGQHTSLVAPQMGTFR